MNVYTTVRDLRGNLRLVLTSEVDNSVSVETYNAVPGEKSWQDWARCGDYCAVSFHSQNLSWS